MRKALTIFCVIAMWLPCAGQSVQDGSIRLKEKDKAELEQAFWDGLMVYRPKGKNLRPDNLQRIDKDLYVSENGFYETESVQNTAFFKKALFSWIPVCESTYPSESVMTLLTGHTGKKDYTIHLLQHRYRFGTAETDIPLALLLEYCIGMGCTPYVGIETIEGDRISAVLFMVNDDKGYCHTFRFFIEKALLDMTEGAFLAEAYTFTPIDNLKQ